MSETQKISMWVDGTMVTAQLRQSEVEEVIQKRRELGYSIEFDGRQLIVKSPEYQEEISKIVSKWKRSLRD